jgi:hypothetical protein
VQGAGITCAACHLMPEGRIRAAAPGEGEPLTYDHAVSRALLRAAAALALTAPVSASAYRPFDSTDAAVADQGQVELELGPIGYIVQSRDRSLVAPGVVLNWGFAHRWEVVLEGRQLIRLGAGTEEPRLRVEDTALSLKHVLSQGSLQEQSGISLATELGALLPTVNGEPGVGAEWAFIASQRWPDLTIHVNGAAAWTRAHEPAAFGGLILEGHDVWAVRPVVEVFVEGERGLRPTASGLVGAIWRVRDALSFDAAVRVAREGSVDTTELRAGVTWGFRAGFRR